MTQLALGTKVKCSGYLEKQKIKYVFANRKQFEDSGSYIEHSLILEEEAEEGNIPVDQLVYKFKETEFEGYVIGRRSIPTMYCYDFPDIQTGFGQFTTTYNRVGCEKCDYVDCYIIAYRMNCKRFVPIAKVNSEITIKDILKECGITTEDVLKRWCELVAEQNKVEPTQMVHYTIKPDGIIDDKEVVPMKLVYCTFNYDDLGDDKEDDN